MSKQLVAALTLAAAAGAASANCQTPNCGTTTPPATGATSATANVAVTTGPVANTLNGTVTGTNTNNVTGTNTNNVTGTNTNNVTGTNTNNNLATGGSVTMAPGAVQGGRADASVNLAPGAVQGGRSSSEAAVVGSGNSDSRSSVRDSGNSAATVNGSGNASIAAGAVQYSSVTNYRAAAASAYGATAQTPTVSGCTMSEGGWGVGFQILGGGISGNKSGKAVWNGDSAKCAQAQAELAVISKGGNAVDSTAALLTGAQVSTRINGAVNELAGARGAKLLGLFQASQAPVIIEREVPAKDNKPLAVTNIFHFTAEGVAPKAAPVICTNKQRPVQDLKTGEVTACVPM